MLGEAVDCSIQTTRQIASKDSQLPQQCSESGIENESLAEVRPMWMAGFIDGEGHFAITRDKSGRTPRYYARIGVTNTDHHTLACIKRTFGGSISRHDGFTGRNPKWKPSWRWSISGEAAEALARKLRPWLVTKRKAVKVFIDFCEYRDQKDTNLITLSRYKLRLRKLNRRGV